MQSVVFWFLPKIVPAWLSMKTEYARRASSHSLSPRLGACLPSFSSGEGTIDDSYYNHKASAKMNTSVHSTDTPRSSTPISFEPERTNSTYQTQTPKQKDVLLHILAIRAMQTSNHRGGRILPEKALGGRYIWRTESVFRVCFPIPTSESIQPSSGCEQYDLAVGGGNPCLERDERIL